MSEQEPKRLEGRGDEWAGEGAVGKQGEGAREGEKNKFKETTLMGGAGQGGEEAQGTLICRGEGESRQELWVERRGSAAHTAGWKKKEKNKSEGGKERAGGTKARQRPGLPLPAHQSSPRRDRVPAPAAQRPWPPGEAPVSG